MYILEILPCLNKACMYVIIVPGFVNLGLIMKNYFEAALKKPGYDGVKCGHHLDPLMNMSIPLLTFHVNST